MDAQRPWMGRILRRDYGMTLVELLAVLAAVAILLGIGAPGFSHLVGGSRTHSDSIELRRLLELARQTAVARNVEVLLCGTADGESCTSKWYQIPVRVFIDKDNNRRWSTGDEQLAITTFSGGSTIHWRASGGRPYLRLIPSGGVKEYGTFTCCPRTPHLALIRRIAINASGRARDVRIDRTANAETDAKLFTTYCG